MTKADWTKADWTKAFRELMALENVPNDLLKQMVGGMADLHDDLREILIGSELRLDRVNEIMAKVEMASAANASTMMAGVPGAVQSAYTEATLLFDNLMMSFETVYPLGVAAMPVADMGTYAVTNTTGLITAVTREIQFQVSAEVLQGILLERKPFHVMQRVSHVLGIRSRGQFREYGTTGISYKAEKIVRTEMMATANAGFHDRLGIAGETFPDLEKVWSATGDWRCRDEHLEAHGQRVPHDGEFVVGGESCQFPLDPSLSARMRINCRCGCMPYRPSWGEISELTGVLDKEVNFERAARQPIAPSYQLGSPSRFLNKMGSQGMWTESFTAADKAIDNVFSNLKSDWLTGKRKLPVTLSTQLEEGVGGKFTRRRVKDKVVPFDIKIAAGARSQGLTYAHEIGHLLDSHFMTLGKSEAYATTLFHNPKVNKELMDGVKDAFKESRAVKTQIGLRDRAKASYMKEFYSYTLETPEIFAQSVAQYVAVKSADPILLKDLSKSLGERRLWWRGNDFDAIETALDKLFKGMGWL